MKIRIDHHRGLFSDVIDLAVADDLDATAMPGVDGRFSACEGVGLFERDLGAKNLSST